MSTDQVRQDELVAAGGEWRGLLFENPDVGLPLSLSWTFTFDYQGVSRDYGSVDPSLTVDWVGFGHSGWHEMAGRHARSDQFSAPIETSLYFFEHHRFDGVDLRVLEQQDDRVRVAIEAWGDLDGLGMDRLRAEDWLRFRGIIVQPAVLPESVDAARGLLQAHTDTDGLVGSMRSHNVEFVEPPR